MKTSGNVDLREGAILKKIAIFAFPMIISNIVQRLFNIADMVIAGKFIGNSALASIGATSTVNLLLVLIFSGFSLGCGILSGHFFGANDKKSLTECLKTTFYTSIIIGVFLLVAGQLLSYPILRMMNVPEDVFDSALSYIKIIFLSMPASMCYNCLYSVSRAVGETRKPMYFLFVSGGLNVVLNILFIICFRWGVSGIAYATVISNYLSAMLIIILFFKGTAGIKLEFSTNNFSSACLKKIIKLSLPPGFNYLLVGITDSIVQAAVNIFGTSYIAGYTAAVNVFGLFTIIIGALNQTTSTFVAQNYGVGNYERIKKGCSSSNKLVIAFSIVMLGMFIICRIPLLKMYTTDPVALKAGETYVFIFGVSAIAYFVKDNIASMLNGLGKTFETMMVSVFVIGFFRILWNYTVFAIFKTYEVLLLNYTVSWSLAYIILSILRKKEFVKLNTNEQKP